MPPSENALSSQGPNQEEKVRIAQLRDLWLVGQAQLAIVDTSPLEKRSILVDMVGTCSELLKRIADKIGDVLRGIGGPLVSPAEKVGEIKQYVWEIIRFLRGGRVGEDCRARGGGRNPGGRVQAGIGTRAWQRLKR